jgi:hypothetical protein
MLKALYFCYIKILFEYFQACRIRIIFMNIRVNFITINTYYLRGEPEMAPCSFRYSGLPPETDQGAFSLTAQ